MANIKYFSGDVELTTITSMDNKQFAVRFPGVKGIRYDGYTMRVGFPKGTPATDIWNNVGVLPVERQITYKSQPSLHECNAKCLNGKHNGICECKCGGKNHGLGAVTSFKQLLAA